MRTFLPPSNAGALIFSGISIFSNPLPVEVSNTTPSSSDVSKSCSTFTDLSSVFSSVLTLKVSSAMLSPIDIMGPGNVPTQPWAPHHNLIKNRFESAVASSLRVSLVQGQSPKGHP